MVSGTPRRDDLPLGVDVGILTAEVVGHGSRVEVKEDSSNASAAAVLRPWRFFFKEPATTEIYSLSLHDALPIYPRKDVRAGALRASIPRPGSTRGFPPLSRGRAPGEASWEPTPNPPRPNAPGSRVFDSVRRREIGRAHV